jgi:hypothetical protein
MTSSSRLRVAISDTAEALEIVKLEVEGATGYPVRPEFQETEFDELVVELRLGAPSSTEPNRIARAIQRTSRDIDVLGVWNAKQSDHEPAPIPSQLVFGATNDSMPDVAKRAVRDQLATAQWHPSTNTTPRGDIPHWQLAVPVLQADGEEVVAVHRRNGYSLRYTPEDVVGTWLGLAS